MARNKKLNDDERKKKNQTISMPCSKRFYQVVEMEQRFPVIEEEESLIKC